MTDGRLWKYSKKSILIYPVLLNKNAPFISFSSRIITFMKVIILFNVYIPILLRLSYFDAFQIFFFRRAIFYSLFFLFSRL